MLKSYTEWLFRMETLGVGADYERQNLSAIWLLQAILEQPLNVYCLWLFSGWLCSYFQSVSVGLKSIRYLFSLNEFWRTVIIVLWWGLWDDPSTTISADSKILNQWQFPWLGIIYYYMAFEDKRHWCDCSTSGRIWLFRSPERSTMTPWRPALPGTGSR